MMLVTFPVSHPLANALDVSSVQAEINTTLDSFFI